MQYVSVFIQVVVLVMLAAICSGLNISLMSLSLGDLRRKAKLGNRAAQKVLPLRQSLKFWYFKIFTLKNRIK